MSEKAFNRVLLVSMAVLVVLLVLMASGAIAQTSSVLSHPLWVADAPTPGLNWHLTLRRAATDTTSDGIHAIECTAITETKFVAYWYRKGAGTDKRKWPVFGVGPGDTCYTVPAGETRTYLFDKPWVQYIIVTSGDAIFAGE